MYNFGLFHASQLNQTHRDKYTNKLANKLHPMDQKQKKMPWDNIKTFAFEVTVLPLSMIISTI